MRWLRELLGQLTEDIFGDLPTLGAVEHGREIPLDIPRLVSCTESSVCPQGQSCLPTTQVSLRRPSSPEESPLLPSEVTPG